MREAVTKKYIKCFHIEWKSVELNKIQSGFKDCLQSEECINFNCVMRSCTLPNVSNGKIVGFSSVTNFAVETKNPNDVIVVDVLAFKMSQVEKYPVGYKVR